jgi:hypothetical protein
MDKHVDHVLPFVKDDRIAQGNYRQCLAQASSILKRRESV